MKINKLNILIITLVLSACKFDNKYIISSYENKVIQVEKNIDSVLVNMIKPYKDSIENTMNEILCYNLYDLDKGKPQSTIGNFVTDLCLTYAQADICIMNNGGLRTNISKGYITRGKIYELMPFENELVILELNKNDYIELLNYIAFRGGEPFSGIKITINKNSEITSHSWPVKFESGEKLKVLTSDYLANGGDNMNFFKSKYQYKVGIKLRDAIIDYCLKQDTISVKIDDRIILDEK